MIDNREALFFKPVAEGYVFRAPNPWVFGRGRFFLVNEAQKARLLGILTARSPLAVLMTFLASFLIMFGASVAAIVFLAGAGEPGAALFVPMVALVLLSMYVALLFCVRPTALLVQRQLPELTPTDQRITAADRRAAAGKAVWVPGQLMIAASHAILSAMFFLQAMQRAHGNPVSMPDNIADFSAMFAGGCFAFSSICMLIPALKKLTQGRDQATPTETTPKKWQLPAFSLAISILAFGFVLYAGHINAASAQRRQKSIEISQRLAALKERIEKSDIAKRRMSLKSRVAANNARINALIEKFNHPTVKCEPAASSDDPALQQTASACAERARQETRAVQAEIAKNTQEAAALEQEGEALQRDVAGINAEIAAIKADNNANR